MPRNGSGVYSKPAGTTAVSGTTIESAKYNSVVDDLVTDANTPRPIVAGGTGASTAAGILAATGVTARGASRRAMCQPPASRAANNTTPTAHSISTVAAYRNDAVTSSVGAANRLAPSGPKAFSNAVATGTTRDRSASSAATMMVTGVDWYSYVVVTTGARIMAHSVPTPMA